VTVQRMLRKYLARNSLCRYRTAAALKIQTSFRRHAQAKHFQMLLDSTVIMQSFFRSAAVRENISFSHFAATEIQRVLRGALSRQAILSYLFVQLREDTAALTLQRLFRGYAVRNGLSFVLSAAVIIQRFWRGRVLRSKFFAAVVVQKYLRKYEAQCCFQTVVASTIMIQAEVRRMWAEKYYYRMIIASIRVQAFFRGRLIRRKLFHCGVAATEIQKIWRGSQAVRSFTARCHLDERKMAAIQIQKIWRGFSHHSKFISSIFSVIMIQRLWRSVLVRSENNQMKKGAILLQSLCRGAQDRKNLVERKMAAIQVQKIWRGFSHHSKYISFIFSVIMIQRHWRLVLVRSKYNKLKKGTILLQSLCRGVQAQSNLYERKIVQIQKIWRGFSHHSKYISSILSAVTIQRHWRLVLVRSRYNQLKKGTILLQSLCRGVQIRNNIEVQDVEQFAASEIQRIWRGTTARINYIVVILSVIKIQTTVRRKLGTIFVRRMIVEEKNKKENMASIKISRIFRAHCQKRKFIYVRLNIIFLQSWVRTICCHKRFLEKKSSSVTIQKYVRGSAVRAYVLVQRQNKLNYYAAAIIQTTFRKYAVNVNFMLMVLSAIKVQSWVRRNLCQNEFLMKRNAAVRIQTNIRRVCAKNHVKNLLFGEVYRLSRHASAQKIQNEVRKYFHHKKLTHAALIIQGVTRCFLAHKCFSSFKSSMLSFQSLFKGYLVRRGCSKKISLVAARIEKANIKAKAEPHMKLGVRTTKSLLTLLNSTSLNEVMLASITLEASTRLSSKCCFAFVQARAPVILYTVSKTLNRSLPHLELLQYILLTLTHVSAHNVDGVATDDSVDTLVELIQMIRDKDNISVLAIRLLTKIVKSSDFQKQKCKRIDIYKRLKSIHGLLKRGSARSNSFRETMDMSSSNRRRSTISSRISKNIHSLETLLFFLAT